MDLNVSGGRTVALEERRRRVDAEVARLKALGASDERGAIERDGEYWVRMNDPEGNEFCVQ
jgi:Glyoxalase-like domain